MEIGECSGTSHSPSRTPDEFRTPQLTLDDDDTSQDDSHDPTPSAGAAGAPPSPGAAGAHPPPPSPVPVDVTDTRNRCSRFDDFLQSLITKRIVVLLLFAAGATSTAFAVHFFKKTPIWPTILATVLYLIVAVVGRVFRDDYLFRAEPHFSLRAFFFVLSAGLTVVVGVYYGAHVYNIKKYLCVGTAAFCLVEIWQPSCDYGVLQLFVCLPLQITVLHYKDKFSWWYVASVAQPFFGLICQVYFLRQFDKKYKAEQVNRQVGGGV